jgi:hypothetical protein
MGGSCGMYGGGETYIQGVVRKSEGKKALRISEHR